MAFAATNTLAAIGGFLLCSPLSMELRTGMSDTPRDPNPPIDPPRDVDEALMWTIQYALSHSKLRGKPGRKWFEHPSDSKIIAEEVVAQLKLSNWKFEVGPPRKSH